MRITSNTFYPYQTRVTQTKQNEQTEQEQTQAAQEQPSVQPETAQSVVSKTLTSSEKAENLKNYFLEKYKSYGLTLSSGLTPAKHGVAPSFSVDPRAIEQAANDPQKAKELDDMLSAAVMIDYDWHQFVQCDESPARGEDVEKHPHQSGRLVRVHNEKRVQQLRSQKQVWRVRCKWLFR